MRATPVAMEIYSLYWHDHKPLSIHHLFSHPDKSTFYDDKEYHYFLGPGNLPEQRLNRNFRLLRFKDLHIHGPLNHSTEYGGEHSLSHQMPKLVQTNRVLVFEYTKCNQRMGATLLKFGTAELPSRYILLDLHCS